ncbi:MAG: WbqC family protein [Flavobacteriaceae bacterium]
MQLIPVYFPSIDYVAQLIKQPVTFTLEAHYQKQTFRNRCSIYGANGRLNLSIPIQHTKSSGHQKDQEVKIKWNEKWQQNHWRSLESAYRSSPFFEFYEDELKTVFFQKKERLMEYNLTLMNCLFEWLDIEMPQDFAKAYRPFTYDELRLINAKENTTKLQHPSYSQVFDMKHGFIDNLSVLDLLFNLGPESKSYIESIG